MSPGQWVSLALLVVGASWLVGVFIEIANGTTVERKSFEAKRAQADAEALLRNADQEVTDRPRVRAGTTFFNREKP